MLELGKKAEAEKAEKALAASSKKKPIVFDLTKESESTARSGPAKEPHRKDDLLPP